MTLKHATHVGAAICGPLINLSGTTTSGGAAQDVAAECVSRRYFFFYNASAEPMYVNFGATAVADSPSIPVLPGEALEFAGSFVPGDLVSMISATTGSKFVCKVG